MKAKITVTLKDQVLDPQGKAVLGGLHSLGYSEVEDVRQGKVFFITLKEGSDAAEAKLREMTQKLLANPVIETFQVELLK